MERQLEKTEKLKASRRASRRASRKGAYDSRESEKSLETGFREGFIGFPAPKLKRRGLSNAERKLTPAHIEALKNYRRAGISERVIAELSGWSLSVVSKYVRDVIPVEPNTDGLADSPGDKPETKSPAQAAPPADGSDGEQRTDWRGVPTEMLVPTETQVQLIGMAGYKGLTVKQFLELEILPCLKMIEALRNTVPHNNGDVLSLLESTQALIADGIAFRKTLQGGRTR